MMTAKAAKTPNAEIGMTGDVAVVTNATAVVNDVQEAHRIRWCLVPENLAQLHATVSKLDTVMADFPGMPNLFFVNRTREAVAKTAAVRDASVTVSG